MIKRIQDYPVVAVFLQAWLITALLLPLSYVEAKTLYVNDQLRVGIRPEPNNDAAPLAVVSTGDKLEQLDTDSGYILVKTSEGVEGWIKDIYTTDQPPAVVQLRALSKSAGGNNAKILELTKQVSLIQSANEVLTNELEEAKSEKNKIQLQLLAQKTGDASGSWMYWLAVMLIFTVASFICGMYWYRNQAMKRLGGLRIYF